MSTDGLAKPESGISREKALMLLRSQNSNERYIAAKALIRLSLPSDLKELMICRKNEGDAYARRWMNYAISACEKRATIKADVGPEQVGNSVSLDERESIRTQAVEWIAGVLLHEVGSKIGLLMGSARREFPTFTGSETERHLSNLLRIFESVSELRKAATAPKSTEFDLAHLIKEVVQIEASETGIDISFVGLDPLPIIADENLLRLALCNGTRNAVEAVQSTNGSEEHRIVITWGITDTDYWVSVIDHGPGIVGQIDSVFEIGRTTKTGHAGFGLAIARQAMERLGGDVKLRSSAGGGATYELRGRLAR